MKNHAPLDDFRSRITRLLKPDHLFLVITFLLMLGFWIWFFFLRPHEAEIENGAIRGRAFEEILAACNSTLALQGLNEHFRREDIIKNIIQPVEGVSAFVSTLAISRDGLVCTWDGVNAVQLSRTEQK